MNRTGIRSYKDQVWVFRGLRRFRGQSPEWRRGVLVSLTVSGLQTVDQSMFTLTWSGSAELDFMFQQNYDPELAL